MIIAFEGIDASGKETQVRMLKKWWDEKYASQKAIVLAYPNYDSLTGREIHSLLRMTNRQRGQINFPLVLQSLMTTNRLENQEAIRSADAAGKLVILDRYWMSGLVYGQYDGLPSEWLHSIHGQLMQPDIWFVLDIPAEESFRRRPMREDAYEANLDRLEHVRQLYLEHGHANPSAHVLDASESPDEIHTIVRSIALSLLN